MRTPQHFSGTEMFRVAAGLDVRRPLGNNLRTGKLGSWMPHELGHHSDYHSLKNPRDQKRASVRVRSDQIRD